MGRNNNPYFNNSGYPDPTAYEAIRAVSREQNMSLDGKVTMLYRVLHFIISEAGFEVVDWVIGKPMGEDQKVLTDALDRAVTAVPVLISQGVDRAMNRFNRT